MRKELSHFLLRRYSIRYPFVADAEMLELESGSRVSGMTSDLSPGGCFVCARRTLDVDARVRGTLTHQGQKVKILAVVRVVKAQWEWASNFSRLIQTQGNTAGLDRESSQIALKLRSHPEVCAT